MFIKPIKQNFRRVNNKFLLNSKLGLTFLKAKSCINFIFHHCVPEWSQGDDWLQLIVRYAILVRKIK